MVPQFYAEFDAAAPVTSTGVVTRVEWVNPRTLIHLRVSEPGKSRTRPGRFREVRRTARGAGGTGWRAA